MKSLPDGIKPKKSPIPEFWSCCVSLSARGRNKIWSVKVDGSLIFVSFEASVCQGRGAASSCHLEWGCWVSLNSGSEYLHHQFQTLKSRAVTLAGGQRACLKVCTYSCERFSSSFHHTEVSTCHPLKLLWGRRVRNRNVWYGCAGMAPLLNSSSTCWCCLVAAHQLWQLALAGHSLHPAALWWQMGLVVGLLDACVCV